MNSLTAIFYYFVVSTSKAFRPFETVYAYKKHSAAAALKMRVPEKSLSLLYTPKTHNQRQYYEYLKNDNVNIVVCAGPAGSGKTALACHYAIEKYKQGVFKKIVITRPLVTVEEDIGFLPGTLNKKMEPWTRPMMDIFNEYYPLSIINNMIKEGIIEISPLAFMRGRTFKDSIIIADEMQNSSPNQMLMVLTRIGDASKLVITGDMNQTDMSKSGLSDFLLHYHIGSRNIDGLSKHVKVVELNNSDIVRHHVVSKILDMYKAAAQPQPTQTPQPTPTPTYAPTNITIEEKLRNRIKDVLSESMRSGGFHSVPDIIGNNSDKPDKQTIGMQDCALITLKEMNITKKYNRNFML